MNKPSLSLIAFSIVLAGCGGSDSGNDNTDSGGTPEVPNMVTVEFVEKATQCNFSQPATDVTVIVQREDGSLLKELTPDSQGKLEFPWDSNSAHFTTVTTQGGNYNIKTQLNWVGDDLGVRSSRSDDLNVQCECQDFEFDTSELAATYPDYELVIARDRYGLTGQSLSKQFCRTSGETFAPVDLMLRPLNSSADAYGVVLDINDSESSIGLAVNMFTGSDNLGVLLDIQTDADDTSHLRSYANTFNGQQHSVFDSERMYVFPQLQEYNLVQAYRFVDLESTAQGEIDYTAIRRIRVTDPEEVQNITIAQNEVLLLEAANQLFSGIISGNSASYDFSHIGAGRSAFTMDVNAANFDWYLTGPLKGEVPDLALPANIENALADSVTRMAISTFGYHQGGSIELLRSEWAKETRTPGALRTAYFDNYDTELISITLF
ncbi:hypothetical protein [Shewanella woodyi]|uniref:hypothetical protein n=1 Tax=Shewanella woodyi TaxID=60961 RepID=UPI003747BACD